MGGNKDRLDDADALDVIVGLQKGDTFDEGTLRAFSAWASDLEEKLSWIKDECVCRKCHGRINAEKMCCVACVMGSAA